MVHAGDDAGARYARQSLNALLARGPRGIRAMRIDDWPDFRARGLMLDISRDKVPTMATLRHLIDLFARLKINQLQLYTEHTFAYRGHERVWRRSSPMTPAQIESLDRYCQSQGVELVPNQNSFGHMERWLRHDAYHDLAETQASWKTPSDTVRTEPTTLNPKDPRSLRLIQDLYDQLLPHFSSRLFNVGCDETFELGQGHSAKLCRLRGRGRVYLDYLLKLHRAVRRRGRRMMFWSDIIHEHPELIPHLPQDVIPLVWGYEADHPFSRQCAALAKCALEFYVCPGTSSWCSFSGRTQNALENLKNAAIAGKRWGASGYLITDWGDYGHRQYLPASYAGVLYGAALSWCLKSNARIDVGSEISRHVYGNEGSSIGQLWLEAGRLHEPFPRPIKNRTVLFELMQTPLSEVSAIKSLTLSRMKEIERAVSGLRRRVMRLRTTGPTRLAGDELIATLGVLRHACKRAEAVLVNLSGTARQAMVRGLAKDMRRILRQHKTLWLARNRRGGLKDSLRHYQRVLQEYLSKQ